MNIVETVRILKGMPGVTAVFAGVHYSDNHGVVDLACWVSVHKEYSAYRRFDAPTLEACHHAALAWLGEPALLSQEAEKATTL